MNVSKTRVPPALLQAALLLVGLGATGCYSGATGSAQQDPGDVGSTGQGGGDPLDSAGSDGGMPGDDEGGESAGEEEPGCARSDPNLLDAAKLFECDPDEDRGAARQRLRLVDNKFWTQNLRRLGNNGFGKYHLGPFGATGTDPSFPYRTYPNDYTLSEVDLTLLLEQVGDFAHYVINYRYRDCADALEESCVRSTLGDVGHHMFRRPLTDDELDRYTSLVLEDRAELGDEKALSRGISRVVGSPSSFFVTELGDPESVDEHGRVRLTDYEIADAISYSILGYPDSGLLQAAESGELQSLEAIETHVRDLARSALEQSWTTHNGTAPRLVDLFQDWLGYAEVANVARDGEGNPGQFSSIATRVLQYKATQQANFLELLFLDPIADVEDGQARYAPNQEARAGFLTGRAFLTLFAHQNETDPVRRGKFVRTQILCQTVPDLPIGVVTEVPGPETGTMRERLAEHSSKAGCASCHELMDPIGLTLEAYDHIGVFRELENGAPVLTTGHLTGTDVDGPLADARGLSEALAGSQTVQQCFTRNIFRGLAGRDETYSDACGLASLDEAYLESGGDLVEVMVAMFTSPEFLYRLPAPVDSCELYE